MGDTDKNKLWEEYIKTKSEKLREQIIIEYVPLVKLVAGRLNMYLGYTVEYDDLVSYGVFGLIDAIDKFDYGKGIKFETYASLRIRGSILDQIRKMDWIPRSVRQKQKQIENAITKLEKEKGANLKDKDIADELGVSLDEYRSWEGLTNVSNIASLDEFMEQGTEGSVREFQNTTYLEPEQAVDREEVKKMLMEALELLTEKEKKVVLLYYYEELTLKEVASVLEVSESRISQLHSKALEKMKKHLGNYFEMLMG
ncbi:MAG: FliA/WhiG family RNA polymerase sigma factor [Lachnospiraceae bacterium]|nr:FliA/WhiG family RNA polymerase sigma factor [Lachnospiraceae bacterium]MDE6761098.1 FliA/WhiG family RNA polymerase sigma factor [Lachnospiraceae bacterium]